MRPVSLSFEEAELERAFRDDHFRRSLTSVRAALVLAAAPEPTVEWLVGRFTFSDPVVLDLKGKGPTRARFLLGPG